MPTYAFRCRACRSKFELFLSLSRVSNARCPSCDGSKLEKLISAPHFILKGSGFYVNDSKPAEPVKDKKKTQRSKPKKDKTG
jgi:putative FmdB family regulatory protein